MDKFSAITPSFTPVQPKRIITYANRPVLRGNFQIVDTVSFTGNEKNPSAGL